jgi:hypothetical protein
MVQGSGFNVQGSKVQVQSSEAEGSGLFIRFVLIVLVTEKDKFVSINRYDVEAELNPQSAIQNLQSKNPEPGIVYLN